MFGYLCVWPIYNIMQTIGFDPLEYAQSTVYNCSNIFKKKTVHNRSINPEYCNYHNKTLTKTKIFFKWWRMVS